jgi:hypothetical protein
MAGMVYRSGGHCELTHWFRFAKRGGPNDWFRFAKQVVQNNWFRFAKKGPCSPD